MARRAMARMWKASDCRESYFEEDVINHGDTAGTAKGKSFFSPQRTRRARRKTGFCFSPCPPWSITIFQVLPFVVSVVSLWLIECGL
jgi:hypothetical protein